MKAAGDEGEVELTSKKVEIVDGGGVDVEFGDAAAAMTTQATDTQAELYGRG